MYIFVLKVVQVHKLHYVDANSSRFHEGDRGFLKQRHLLS